MTRDELAEAISLPEHIKMTWQLEHHVSRLGEGTRARFINHARRLFNELDPCTEEGVTGLDLINLAVRLDQAPGTTLSFISNIESLLSDLGYPVRPSLTLENLKRRLQAIRTDGRLIAVAIGEEQSAHLITVNDLVADPTASLRDAVHDLAIRAMTAWRSRPAAGLAVRMKLISAGKGGFYVNGSATKTTLRDMFISPELVVASNRVAAGIPGRHRFGIDPDVFLEKAEGFFIPALDKDGRYRGPKEYFERHWYGIILKRRVRAWCERQRLSRDQTEHLLGRISGKSSRRGGQTDNVFLNMSMEDCATEAHFESSHVGIIYAQGFDMSATRVAYYATSRAHAAFDKLSALKA